MQYGISSLSDAELISLIIRTGSKKENSIQVAQKIMCLADKKLKDVFFKNISELIQIDGVGKVKAIQLQAIGEIIKRVEHNIYDEKKYIYNTKDVFNLLMPEMRYLKKEELHVLYLSNSNMLIKIKRYANNNIGNIKIDPNIILKDVIKEDIPRIILVHNHPSGNSNPSKQDKEFTKYLNKIALIMGVELLEHIVIANDKYSTIEF